LHTGKVASLNDLDRKAGVGAHFNTQTATHTPTFDHGAVLVPQFKPYPPRAQGADADAGTADTLVDPRIAPCPIDLSDTHIHFFSRRYRECICGADFHTLSTQGTRFHLRVDKGSIHRCATIIPAKLDATGWAYLTAHAATNARGLKCH